MKAVFTVGLCTSAYWSLVKTHQSLFGGVPAAAPAVSSSDAMVLSGSGKLVHDRSLGGGQAADVKNAEVEASAALAPTAPVEVIAAATATSEVTPTPAEDPNATVQGQAQGQAQTEESAHPYAISPPIYPVPVFPQDGANNSGQSGNANRDGTAARSDLTADAGMLGGPMQGGMPAASPSGPIRGAIDISQNGGPSVEFKSNLTSTDVQWLLSSPLKATVPQTLYSVTGKNQDGSDLPAETKVSSTRWSFREGIKSEASFVVRPSSGVAPVVFDVQLKLLTSNQGVEQPIQMTLRPFESIAKSEVINGRPMRVFSFKINDVSLGYENESAGYIQAQLSYEIQNGSYQFVGGSFGFIRKQVKISTQAWDPARQPASNDPWIVVDQLPLTIQLEKSP